MIKFRLFHFVAAAVFGGLVLLLAGCASSSPPQDINIKPILRKDNRIGNELAMQIEGRFQFIRDVEVSVYLRNLAEKLLNESTPLKQSPLGIYLIREADASLRNYGLPGIRIYLTVSLLKMFDHENEVASLIALELAHIELRHFVNNLSSSLPKTQGAGGVPAEQSLELNSSEISSKQISEAFLYTAPQYEKTIQRAVELLYRAGFDPRGVSALWNRYRKDPKRAPFEPGFLKLLDQHTFQALSAFPPLRNPKGNSPAFMNYKD